MLTAKNSAGTRISAAPDLTGTCPLCDAEVVPKCGEIVIWHWAHKANENEECDSWHARETEWHREWKSRFPMDWREIAITKNGKKHRADVRILEELVLEFQYSPISTTDIRAREAFYGRRMAWVWDARKATEKGRLTIFDRGDYQTFLWKHPRRVLPLCERPVFFDLGNEEILDVRKIHGDTRQGGWGYLRSHQGFVDAMTLKNPRGWMDWLVRGSGRYSDPFHEAEVSRG